MIVLVLVDMALESSEDPCSEGPVQPVPCGDGSWFTQAWLDRSPVPFTGPEPWPNGLHTHLSSAQLKQHAVIQRQADETLYDTTETIAHKHTRTKTEG